MEQNQNKNIVQIKDEEYQKLDKKTWSGNEMECDFFINKLPYLR